MKTPNFATKTPEKVHKPTAPQANKSPIQNPEILDNSMVQSGMEQNTYLIHLNPIYTNLKYNYKNR